MSSTYSGAWKKIQVIIFPLFYLPIKDSPEGRWCSIFPHQNDYWLSKQSKPKECDSVSGVTMVTAAGHEASHADK